MTDEPITFPEVCRWCGDPFRLEVLDVWDGRDFALTGCCEATDAEALEWLQDPADGARLLRSLDLDELVPGLGGIRRVVDHDSHLQLDWNVSVRLICRGDSFTQTDARRFISAHHHHAPNANAAWRFGGSVWNGPTLLGVVWVGNPVSRALMSANPGLLEVNRLCLDLSASDQLRWKAASAGYRWAAEEAERRGFTAIQTYTLADDESGMSLRYARWKVLDENAGGKSWHSASRNRPNATAQGRKVRWGKRLHPKVPVPGFNPRPLSPARRQLALALEAA